MKKAAPVAQILSYLSFFFLGREGVPGQAGAPDLWMILIINSRYRERVRGRWLREDGSRNIPSVHVEPFTVDFDRRRRLPETTAEVGRRIECAYLQRVLEKYRGRTELCAR
jgi:hypothetical protein